MKDTSRAAGQRKVVIVTATIAGLGVAGAVGLAVVAAHGATTTTNTISSSTDGSSTSAGGSSAQGWQPSGTSLGSGSSGSGSHASSGGS